jgi:hypothetical protein
MSQKDLEEIDVNDLSFEELDSLLNEVEGSTSNNLEAETDLDSQTEKESESIETSDTNEENVDIDTAESTDKTSDVDDEESTSPDTNELVEPQFQGKSKDDLLKMQRNATKKISQQNNEIYYLNKRLDDFLSKSKVEKQQTNETNDVLKDYESSDIQAIETLVNKVLSEKNDREIEIAQKEKEAVMKEHDVLWDNLSVLNPILFNNVKDALLDEMKSNPDNTVYKKGWLKGIITEKSKDFSNDNLKVKKPKKIVTTVMGSNGSASSINSNNKAVEDMTADEYVKYMHTQGIRI